MNVGDPDTSALQAPVFVNERSVVFHLEREMMRQTGPQAPWRVTRQAEECQDRARGKLIVAGVIIVCAALFIQIVSLLDQTESDLLDEEVLRPLGVGRNRGNVVEAP